MRLTLILLLGVLAACPAAAQPAATLPARGESLVATKSSAFAFYSDPVTNLHDFLVWNARSQNAVEPAPDCLAGVPADQRAAFEHAREHYKVFSTPAGSRLLLALRFQLAGFGDFGIADGTPIAAALAELSAAAPAYRRCWWSTHDARNRRWVAALEPLLAAHEEALGTRLAELYGKEFQRPIPVDVVSYATFAGADSVVDPDHLLISSVDPSNAGHAALEVVFHEASHTVFGPRLDGQLWTDLEAAAKTDGAPLPSDFWHAMLFYTTGSAVKARLAERGVAYEQYLYTEGLFERSWPGYRRPLERLWQPYLDRRVPRADALKQIVGAHKLPERDTAPVAASRTFVFYSDLITNLHDFLVWNARSQQPVEARPDCLARLPAQQRAAFEHARDHYARTFAGGAGDTILLSMRWRLARFGEMNLADPAQIAATVAELAPATPAYETCWWREHDARNQRWIATLLPLLETNESVLRVRLGAVYGNELARSLPVDVVGYAGGGGQSTVLNPHLLLISSAKLDSGYAALEALCREASHTLFGLRAGGALWNMLRQISAAAARPLSENVSRLLMLFTTGETVRTRLAAQGVSDYNPWVYSEGLFDGPSRIYRDVLERVWRPYLDGRMAMTDAVKQLVEALPAESR